MVPLSLSKNCICWNCGKSEITIPLCQHCRALQDPPEKADYFSLFGNRPSLNLNEDELRSRFYELAKQLHPDRYSLATPKEQSLASKWTQILNRGYQALKETRSRGRYLVELLLPTALEEKKQIPLELAEEYFELQDLLTEEDQTPLRDFSKKLDTMRTANENLWQELKQKWDDTAPNRDEQLRSIANLLSRERYIESMAADIERKLKD